jgi:hypothetical protein
MIITLIIKNYYLLNIFIVIILIIIFDPTIINVIIMITVITCAMGDMVLSRQNIHMELSIWP